MPPLRPARICCRARVVRGGALVRIGRNAEAIPALRDVVKTDPDDQNAHFYLAQAYRAVGDKQSAASELETYSKLEAAAREHTTRQAQDVIRAKEDCAVTHPVRGCSDELSCALRAAVRCASIFAFSGAPFFR